jgi:hypothetical protein
MPPNSTLHIPEIDKPIGVLKKVYWSKGDNILIKQVIIKQSFCKLKFSTWQWISQCKLIKHKKELFYNKTNYNKSVSILRIKIILTNRENAISTIGANMRHILCIYKACTCINNLRLGVFTPNLAIGSRRGQEPTSYNG